jgi:hypothetical protein
MSVFEELLRHECAPLYARIAVERDALLQQDDVAALVGLAARRTREGAHRLAIACECAECLEALTLRRAMSAGRTLKELARGHQRAIAAAFAASGLGTVAVDESGMEWTDSLTEAMALAGQSAARVVLSRGYDPESDMVSVVAAMSDSAKRQQARMFGACASQAMARNLEELTRLWQEALRVAR